MKKLFISILACLPLACYATSGLNTNLNAVKCTAINNGNLTNCFQNNTGKSLSGYTLLMNIISKDGTSYFEASELKVTQPNSFIVTSTLTSQLQDNGITSAWLFIVQGDAVRYQIIPGCAAEITPTSLTKPFLSIHEVGGVLRCS